MQYQDKAASADHGERQCCDDALLLLDEVCDIFADGSFFSGMGRLVEGLHQTKRVLSPHKWGLLKNNWMHHPVARIVHQDPITSWSYRKPRGYPGDASLLDFIYRSGTVQSEVESASDCGRGIYRYTVDSPAAAAVRERRDILTALVDRVSQERNAPSDVFGIACGHLREAETSRAAREGRIARWVALDQDEASVVYVRDTAPAPSIHPLHGSVRGLLGGRYDLGRFDMIYAAGLYDYLVHKVAKRLTEIAFAMLNPGGTLLFANFAKDIRDDGYLETFMDWHLIYRDEAEMDAICSGIPASDADRRIFRGENRNIIYATLTKS